jgi:hypothetical protein
MNLPKLAAVAPVIAVLALSAPVATASAAVPPGTPGSQIPCYPFPAFCTPNGQPLAPWPFPFAFPAALFAALAGLTTPASATPSS